MPDEPQLSRAQERAIEALLSARSIAAAARQAGIAPPTNPSTTANPAADPITTGVIRNNTIFNCGQTGICGSLGAVFSRIENNHIYVAEQFQRSAVLHVDPGVGHQAKVVNDG